MGTLLADGRYEVLRTLGRGASGITYCCRDRDRQQASGGGDAAAAGADEVAIKCLTLRRCAWAGSW